MTPYLMHPSYAAHALQQLVDGKQILVVVDRAPERRMILRDLLVVLDELPDTSPFEVRFANGQESIRVAGRRDLGRIEIIRADPHQLRGHVADLALVPYSIAEQFQYELQPVLISRSGLIEFYSRVTPRP
jgi:hypothetical protein